MRTKIDTKISANLATYKSKRDKVSFGNSSKPTIKNLNTTLETKLKGTGNVYDSLNIPANSSRINDSIRTAKSMAKEIKATMKSAGDRYYFGSIYGNHLNTTKKILKEILFKLNKKNYFEFKPHLFTLPGSETTAKKIKVAGFAELDGKTTVEESIKTGESLYNHKGSDLKAKNIEVGTNVKLSGKSTIDETLKANSSIFADDISANKIISGKNVELGDIRHLNEIYFVKNPSELNQNRKLVFYNTNFKNKIKIGMEKIEQLTIHSDDEATTILNKIQLFDTKKIVKNELFNKFAEFINLKVAKKEIYKLKKELTPEQIGKLIEQGALKFKKVLR